MIKVSSEVFQFVVLGIPSSNVFRGWGGFFSYTTVSIASIWRMGTADSGLGVDSTESGAGDTDGLTWPSVMEVTVRVVAVISAAVALDSHRAPAAEM